MVKVSRKELLSRMEPAAKVAASRTPKELLKWIRLTHDGSRLTIQAWDGDVGIKLTLACEGTPCDFLLPAQHAVAVLKAFSSDTVTLTPGESRTLLKGNREEFKFPVMDADDFPTWKHSGDEFTLSAAVFNPAIQHVRCAVSEGDARYPFSGVLLEAETGYVVATNGKILCAAMCGEGAAGRPRGTLPLKMADAACRTLAGDFKVRMTQGSIELDDGQSCIFGRLVAGLFPKWQPIVEFGTPDVELDIGVADLLRVTRQAMLASDVERQSIDLRLSGGTLSVSSGSADRGDSIVDLPIASDADIKVTFDGTFLAGMLAGLDPLEEIHWCIASETANKFTLRNWTGVIMPMVDR